MAWHQLVAVPSWAICFDVVLDAHVPFLTLSGLYVGANRDCQTHQSIAISQHTFPKFSGIVLLSLIVLDSILACIVLSDLDNYSFELFLFVCLSFTLSFQPLLPYYTLLRNSRPGKVGVIGALFPII